MEQPVNSSLSRSASPNATFMEAGSSTDAKNLLDAVDKLKFFLATAPGSFEQTAHSKADEPISAEQCLNRFALPTGDLITCVLWNGLYHITGTDIVRALTFRFLAFGRPVRNTKKFEEGVFSDLRNLKSGTDATLEEPKSDFLELLFKFNCIRTQKKQKVFYWFSVPHDRLFLDALDRDLKREKLGMEATTQAISEPALSFVYNPGKSLYDQFAKAHVEMRTDSVSANSSTSAMSYGNQADDEITEIPRHRKRSRDTATDDGMLDHSNTGLLGAFSLFEGSPSYKQRRKPTAASTRRFTKSPSSPSPSPDLTQPTISGPFQNAPFYYEEPRSGSVQFGNDVSVGLIDRFPDRYHRETPGTVAYDSFAKYGSANISQRFRPSPNPTEFNSTVKPQPIPSQRSYLPVHHSSNHTQPAVSGYFETLNDSCKEVREVRRHYSVSPYPTALESLAIRDGSVDSFMHDGHLAGPRGLSLEPTPLVDNFDSAHVRRYRSETPSLTHLRTSIAHPNYFLDNHCDSNRRCQRLESTASSGIQLRGGEVATPPHRRSDESSYDRFEASTFGTGNIHHDVGAPFSFGENHSDSIADHNAFLGNSASCGSYSTINIGDVFGQSFDATQISLTTPSF